jgi:ribosome biogenesis GTPase
LIEANPAMAQGSSALLSGTVVKKTQGQYWVDLGGKQIIPCGISNKLRKQLVYPTADPASVRRRVVAVAEIREADPLAVGDRVVLEPTGAGSGLILDVLPRRNKLVRRIAGGGGRRSGGAPIEQVIAANVDYVVPVFAAAFPHPTWALLDRYLVAAESQGLPALICITKLDIVEAGELADAVEEYRRIGYPVILTSARTGEGIAELHAALAGRVSVLMGKSGVGKTSLLNALEPGLGRRVNEVSEVTGKGKHTTTYLELVPLASGGGLIDTPGMREFTLWQVGASDLAELFPELRAYLGQCRFGADCGHDHEPGCAVKAAVACGEVSERRYESYLHLRQGQGE